MTTARKLGEIPHRLDLCVYRGSNLVEGVGFCPTLLLTQRRVRLECTPVKWNVWNGSMESTRDIALRDWSAVLCEPGPSLPSQCFCCHVFCLVQVSLATLFFFLDGQERSGCALWLLYLLGDTPSWLASEASHSHRRCLGSAHFSACLSCFGSTRAFLCLSPVLSGSFRNKRNKWHMSCVCSSPHTVGRNKSGKKWLCDN